METARCIPPNSANPLGLKARGNAEPIQPATRLAGVESGRWGPKRFRKNSHGRGAFQTPNAYVAAAKAVVGMKIRWPQGHAGSTPARGTRFLKCEPLHRRHAPDVQRCTAAAQGVLGQVQYGDGADVEFAFTYVDIQGR